MSGRDSLCDDVRNCTGYSHKHCTVCWAVLNAVGGGGDDGRRIAGYEDEHGSSARICTGCGDEDFLLCEACFDEDPHCDACRKDRAA